MADSSAITDLLVQAGSVFSLAGKLGQLFHEDGQSGAIPYDPSNWQRHEPAFNEFCDAAQAQRDVMYIPPEGFEPVAERLLDADCLAKRMGDCLTREAGQGCSLRSGQPLGKMLGVTNPGRPESTAYAEFIPDLNSVWENGWRAVKEVATAQRLDDLFVSADEPRVGDATNTGWSPLDRFQVTPAVRTLDDVGEQSQKSDSPEIIENEVVAVEPFEVIELRRWLSVDGIKGHWNHFVESAQLWLLDVDGRHRNIAFFLRLVIGGDPPEVAIRDYLFRVHNILPADETDLANLEQLLRTDAARIHTLSSNDNSVIDSEPIERLRAFGNGTQEDADTGAHPPDQRELAKPTVRIEEPANRFDRRAEWMGKALVLRKANPNMSKVEIARRVGVHAGQLSPKRCPELAALEKMLQSDTTSGHITKDSESGLSDVEAAASTDDKADRGEQITGSSLFREYCVKCDEPIRVPQNQVGQNPQCSDCDH